MSGTDESRTTGAWRLEDAGDGVSLLVLDVPDRKVNILAESVLRELDGILDGVAKDSETRALVVVGGKESTGTFIAGADVHEIRAMESAAEATAKAGQGQAVLGKLSSIPQVTVAAIHGNCLGGGTELALACDLRVASLDERTRIGLPETQLGILPGFGGTQRLPRLVGLARALPIVLGGKPVSVRKAAKIGLVDRVVYPGLLRDEAVRLAREALQHEGKTWRPKRPRRPWYERLLEALPAGRSFIAKRARKDVLRRAGPHYPAPMRAIDAMVEGYGKSLEEGLKLEASLLGDLAASPVCKSLIDLFLASEEARRGGDDEPVSGPAAACVASGARVGILGAGVMGGGLAALFARKGWRVRMKDISAESIQTGLRKVHQSFAERVRRGRMSESERTRALSAITTTLDNSGFGRIPLVIEAIVESLEIKKKAFAEIEENLQEDAVLASNTSSLSITEMQKDLRRPGQLVGLHFFNPVERMMLVEVVRGEQTSDDAVRAAEAVARRLGKVPVRVADGPGFLVNRLLGPYLNEAVRLFEEGYSPEDVDREIRGFGMPMGPFELLDEVGLDVAAKVCEVLGKAFGERARPPAVLERLRQLEGSLGKKTGKGFYVYRGRKKRPNTQVFRLGGTRGKDFRPADPEMWIHRLIHPIVDEAARALEEGIVDRAASCDLAMVLGTGFAPFRGGPLRYADSVGPKRIVESLEALREPRLVPCELLRRLAREDGRFYAPASEESEPPRAEESALHRAQP